MLQFYKPNPKNTGSACSLYYSTSKECFFLQLLKQDGWNGKNGIFANSRKDPLKNVTLKLSALEAAGMLLTLEKAQEKFSGYHQYPGARFATTITLEPYLTAPQPGAYSLSVFKKDKQDATAPNVSFRIGLYAAEARLLREYLVIGLGQILLYRPDEKAKEELPTDDKEAPKVAAENESPTTPASPSEETPVF